MKAFRPWAAAFALAALLAACGGGSIPPSEGGIATVTGVVRDSAGQPLAGVHAQMGPSMADTDANGVFSVLVDHVPSTGGPLVFTKAGYAPQTRITGRVLNPGEVAHLDATLAAVGTTVAFDPATPSTLSAAGSTARVVLPAGALVRSAGGAPTGPAQAQLTVIDPSLSGDTMPGNYTLFGGNGIESFGALQVDLLDADGTRLNLAAGQTATIRIPAVSRGGAPLPLTIPLYYLDDNGFWVQEGNASLKGGAPAQYYEGSVGHFSVWNADKPLDTVYINGCIEEAGSTRVGSGTLARSYGVDYIGAGMALTDDTGAFRIGVKKNATTRLYGQKFGPARYGPGVDVPVGSTDVTMTACLVLDTDGIGATPTFPSTPPGPPPPGDYAGNYSGSFAGAETGTWNVAINSSGVVTGSGHSATYNLDFVVSGSVVAGGGVSLNAAAGTAGASIFSGSIDAITGAVSGTWRYATTPSGQDGTFTGSRN
jgi:hypothetical protein